MAFEQVQIMLLTSAVKCGEIEAAADIYRDLAAADGTLPKQALLTAVDMYLKLGSWQEALAVLENMVAQVNMDVAPPHRMCSHPSSVSFQCLLSPAECRTEVTTSGHLLSVCLSVCLSRTGIAL
jgi:hypothetical protein